MRYCATTVLGHRAQKLCLEDKLANLVLLRCLVCFVVLPSNHLFALLAADITDDVFASRHVPVTRFACGDIDYRVEEEGLAMLTAEVLQASV